MILFYLICVGILTGAQLIQAADQTEPVLGPEINSYYQDADPKRWRDVFEQPGREPYDRRDEIVDALEIQTGMSVADVGAGTGLFTMLFAKRVGPEGRVYAVDISEPFIEAILTRAADAGLDNIIAVLNHQQSAELPANSVDLVFLSDTYHHFEYPHAMLDSLHLALRPSGILTLIDFRRRPEISSDWVMGHVRAGRAQVIDEVEQAGFELIDEPLVLQGNYFLRFRKTAD